jgi:hypothetical protein
VTTVPLNAGDRVSLAATTNGILPTGQFMFGVGLRCD